MTRNRHTRGAAEPRDHRASGANVWGMKFWTVSWKGFGNFAQPADQPKPTWTVQLILECSESEKRARRACEATAGPWSRAAVSEHQESKLFAPLDATVSLRTCPRGRARRGQDCKDAGNVERWCATSSLVRAADASMLIAVLDRRQAARVVRSSPAFCHDH